MTLVTDVRDAVQRDLPGVLLCAVIGLAAGFIADHYGGPLLLFTLLLGIAFNFLSSHPRMQAGIERCSQTLLRWAVALLGARLTLDQVAGLGWHTVALVMLAVASTLLLGVALAGRFGLERWQGALSGGSVSICGASAALAIASVLPAGTRRDAYTLVVVVTVTALSTVSMVLYPIVAGWLQLPAEAQGIFLGATIHDVAQVVGAGYGVGPQAGDLATLVKLLRVSLLAVVVIVIGSAFRATPHAPGRASPPVPWFLIVFLLLIALNSSGAFGSVGQANLSHIAQTLLVVAIAALGVKTSFVDVARAGWNSFALIGIETLWLAGFTLGALALLHI